MYRVAVKVNKIDYKHFAVPEEIYIYIKQLEMYIKYPKDSQLERLYPKLFIGHRSGDNEDSKSKDR